MTTANAVTDDSKLTNEQRGMLDRREDEIKKRLNQGVINFDWVMAQKQRIIEGLDVLLLATLSMMLTCTKQFQPAKFIRFGWSFWRGPANGDDWPSEIEQDTRSVSLSEFDPTKVRLETMLRPGESSITGEKNLERLEEGAHVRLGANHFLALLENKSTIPESWKQKVDGKIRRIYFDGTVLRSPEGRRSVLYLCWSDDGWFWNAEWLGADRDVRSLSASLLVS